MAIDMVLDHNLRGPYLKPDGSVPQTLSTYTPGEAPSYLEGQVWYDSNDKTLVVDTANGSRLQVGQEDYVRVINRTGVKFDNGAVLYVSGAENDRPQVEKSIGDTHAKATGTIGLATHDIENDQEGMIVTKGLIRDFDTRGTPFGEVWAAGERIWLSATIDGGMTNARPVAPYHAVSLGWVLKIGETDGIMLIKVEVGDALSALHDVGFGIALEEGQVLRYNLATTRWENVNAVLLKSWSGNSPLGVSGLSYIGGFYKFGAADWTPSSGPQAFGSANNSHPSHALIVMGPPHIDDNMIIRVTGTSMTDLGVRTPGDFEDIDTAGASQDDYLETAKKFLGTVTFTLQSGTSSDVNYGLSKYWDRKNTSFTVIGLECLWLANKNDNSFNVELIHHKATGWTYNAAAEPDPPAVESMNTDHVTEINNDAAEPGCWKRADLSILIRGDLSEGIMFRVTTGTNGSLDSIDCEINYI